ncbi:endolysin [Microbacterium phage PineapplePluto]|nr:endolysin [Microbacterium phage PineapplePluto]
MSDVKGGYLRPVSDPSISSSWQAHKNRKPPSQEPGTDFSCAYGSLLVSPEDGVIVDAKSSTSAATGRYITIDLNDGRRVRMLHLSRLLKNVGDRVKRGEAVAVSGASARGLEWGVGAHVHVTLWDSHKYVFGPNGTMDFVPQIGGDNDGGGGAGFSQVTKDRQNFLISRGWKLEADGIEGPRTRQVYKEYQAALNRLGYGAGAEDGIWGSGTQRAHQKYWNDLNPKKQGPLSFLDIQRALNKFGYKLVEDNIWGRKSSNALADFQKKHGLAVDRIVGPATRQKLGI